MSTIRDKSNTSAWVVLNKKGEHIANVVALYTKSAATVEVLEIGMGVTHTKRAGGYGYDKFTAALAGATIDGIRMENHCGQDDATNKILKAYHSGKLTEEQAIAKAAKIGARFANWGMVGEYSAKWGSLYYEDGLSRLRIMGYKIIQAL